MKKKLDKKKKHINRVNLKQRDNRAIAVGYRMAFGFIKYSRHSIFSVTAILLAFFLAGFLFVFLAPDFLLDIVLAWLKEFIQGILEETQGLGFFGMARFIFINNASIAFLSILLGFFLIIFPPIGIFFVLLLASNGFIIGLVSGLVVSETGILSLWHLVPHGIFEISAVVISFGIGLKAGLFVFHKDRWKRLKVYIRDALLVFFLVVLPLLLIAAFIEAGLIVFFGG